MSYKVRFDTVLLRSLKSILQDPKSRKTNEAVDWLDAQKAFPYTASGPNGQDVLARWRELSLLALGLGHGDDDNGRRASLVT